MSTPNIIHLLSDFGSGTPEHTAAQAQFSRYFSQVPAVISLPPLAKGYIVPAVVFLQMVEESFGEHCLHIAHLSLSPDLPPRYVAAKCGESWYMAPDNGLLPMVLADREALYFDLPFPSNLEDALREVYLPAARNMFTAEFDTQLLTPRENPRKAAMLAPTLQQNSMRLTVIYNDTAGNAIVNLKLNEFERLRNGRRFRLMWPGLRKDINHISRSIADADQGYLAAVFGLGGYLKLGMNGGSAKQYYGLAEKQTLLLEFMD